MQRNRIEHLDGRITADNSATAKPVSLLTNQPSRARRSRRFSRSRALNNRAPAARAGKGNSHSNEPIASPGRVYRAECQRRGARQ